MIGSTKYRVHSVHPMATVDAAAPARRVTSDIGVDGNDHEDSIVTPGGDDEEAMAPLTTRE